jgi:hypothetical protein
VPKTEPAIGAGDIPIKLGDDELVLRPTLGAAQFLSRQGGGLMGAVQRCGQYDMDTVVLVIAQGLGLGTGSKDLPAKIFEAGMHAMVPKAIRFLNTLSNGGRPPSDDGDAGAEGEDETDPQTGASG